MPHKTKTPRVWIELERPADIPEATKIETLANAMLRRLNGSNATSGRFFWSVRDLRWCYGSQMGYTVLQDNGEWFNLEHSGRPIK